MNVAVCVIGYNRIDCILRVLNSLEKAYYSHAVTLILSIDKSENLEVRNFVENYKWNFGDKKVVLQKENLGLRKHVLLCGSYSKDYDALVVLEDDITVSPYYFDYVVQTVEKYQNDDRIAGISLYNFPRAYVTGLPFLPVQSSYDVFMINCAMSWGQVWTWNKWEKFMQWYQNNSDEFNIQELPENLNQWGPKSWLKYHTRYCIETNKFFVYPYQSLSTNNDDVGTHGVKRTTHLQSNQCCFEHKNWKLPLFEDCVIKYDGFFEPKFLAGYLGIDEKELCVDFYGNKDNKINRRYRLTRKSLPYKVIKSFSLERKPFEANIIFDVAGSGIFLYDTLFEGTPPKPITKQDYYEYFFLNSLDLLSNKELLCIVYSRLSSRILRLMNKLFGK